MHLPSLLAVAVLILAAAIGFAVERIAAQTAMLRGYRSVPGERSAEPGPRAIAYRVGFERHETSRLAPLPSALPGQAEAEAEALEARWRGGEEPAAWVDPDDPSRAYLLPAARFWPYAIVLVAAAGAAALLARLHLGGVFEAPPRVVPQGEYAWHVLAAGLGPEGVAAASAVIAGAWYAVAVIAMGHYFVAVDGAAGAAAGVGMPYLLLGVLPAKAAAARWRSAAPLDRPEVTATQPGARLDMPVIVRLSWPIAGAVELRRVALALCCSRRGGLASTELYRSSKELASAITLEPGRRVSGEASFEVPAKKRRDSSPFTRWRYPRVSWHVEAIAEHGGGPPAVYRFPLDAAATSDRPHNPLPGPDGLRPSE